MPKIHYKISNNTSLKLPIDYLPYKLIENKITFTTIN